MRFVDVIDFAFILVFILIVELIWPLTHTRTMFIFASMALYSVWLITSCSTAASRTQVSVSFVVLLQGQAGQRMADHVLQHRKHISKM